jgi:hypothetical protein
MLKCWSGTTVKKAREPKPDEPELTLWMPARTATAGAILWLAYVVVHFGRMRFGLHWEDWVDVSDTILHLSPPIAGHLLKKIGLCAAFWFGAAGLGGVVRKSLIGSASRGLETALIDAALGFGSLSLALFAIGLSGSYSPAVLNGLFLVVMMLGVPLAIRAARADQPVQRKPGRGAIVLVAAALILLATLATILAVGAPETFYDALVYHLALPKLYLLRSAVVPTPENIYSGLPQGIQMIYGLALAVSGEDFAGLLHASFAFATTVGLWVSVGRIAGAQSGAMAAVLFQFCPIVLYASGMCGVDLAAAFYGLVAYSVAAGALGTARESARGRSLIIGLLLGFALGVKVNAIPLAVMVALVHVMLEVQRDGGRHAAAWTIAALGLAAAPWPLKNLWFYGNPFYPFMHDRFGGLRPGDWPAFLGAAGARDLGAVFSTWRGFFGFVSFPFQSSLGHRAVNDWLGPLIMPLSVIALAVRWGPREESDGAPVVWRWTGLIAAACVVWTWLTSSIVRFLVPALPVVAATIALAITRGNWPWNFKRTAWSFVMLGCLVGFEAVWREGRTFGRWHFVRGEVSEQRYLSIPGPSYGQPPYPAFAWINHNLPPGAKVLLLGEARGFQLDRDFIAPTVYDFNPFWETAAAALDADELRARLRAAGVTHILLNLGELHYRRGSSAVLPRDVAGSDLADSFVQRWLDQVWEDRLDSGPRQRWLVVYAMRSVPRTDGSPRNPIRELLRQLRQEGE